MMYDELIQRKAPESEVRRAALREGRVEEYVVSYLGPWVALHIPVRYGTPPEDRGYTRPATEAVEKYALGELLFVRGWVTRGDAGWVTLAGTQGVIHLCGFAWGYGGTGPAGLVRALVSYGCNPEKTWAFVGNELFHEDHVWYRIPEELGGPAPALEVPLLATL